MLKKIAERDNNIKLPELRIADAGFPAPFPSGLEYSSPARGTWNIVHTGMLIPEAHEIFVCAAGCLRGVVLTAAEMNAADRFSTVAVREHNLLDGDMEDLVVEGVSDIIRKLPIRPPAVLVYTSCVHHFAGCDLDMIYARLRENFPDIDFTDCYMNPIMRKSGLTPDQLMRSRLYTLLHERSLRQDAVAILGNDLPTDEGSDLMRLLRAAGCKVHEITSCRTYDEYQEMAESSLYITYNPDAVPGAKMLADRLGGEHIHIDLSFDPGEIDEGFYRLAEELRVHITGKGCASNDIGASSQDPADTSTTGAECSNPQDILTGIRDAGREAVQRGTAETLALIGRTPVAIDYTFCPRPLGLARFLLDNGFNVRTVYADGIPAADRNDFEYLKENYPDLLLRPTVHTGMRFANAAHESSAILAIGQKAAYFENTDHFVNVVEGGGMLGYEAVTRTLALMREAYNEPKNMKELVQIKGLGCDCCL